MIKRLSVLALASALSSPCEPAMAEPPPWSAATRLTLTRCLIAEADGHTADYLPILGVLDRRASITHRTIDKQARAYCGIFRLRSRRARAILASTVSHPVHGSHALWERAHDTVVRYERGLVTDTCGADHWRGRGDAKRATLLDIDCGATANFFSVEKR